MMCFRWGFAIAAFLPAIGAVQAQSPPSAVPQANPGRPTVSSPATLTPVGYLQSENGVMVAEGSPDVDSQSSISLVAKLTVTPRLELIGQFSPIDYSEGVIDNSGLPGTQSGSGGAGLQVVVLPGEGLKPTIALSYIDTFYSGPAPNVDVGGSTQSAIFLWSQDFGAYHVDANGIFNEQNDGAPRRAQFGQTLSISHPLGPFVLAGELWHFTQPFSNGNAVGTLWALSYAVHGNLVFDVAVDRGLTSSSTHWETFAGFTYLFPNRLWKPRK